MQEIQHTLDILSLLPIATAFALFGFHMLNCWNRSGHAHQITQAGNVAESETGIPVSVEAHLLAEMAAQDPEFCREYEQIMESGDDSLEWEPRWAALEMEPVTVQTTVQVDEEPEIAPAENQTPFHAFSRSSEPADPNSMNSQQLRQECRRLGVRWRNAHGKGRHMTRPEMLQQIGEAIA